MVEYKKWLLWPKALYFMLHFCVYSTFHFSHKYLKESYGITDSEYGLLNSLTAISFLASIFWTNVADRTQMHTLILSISAALYALCYSALWLAQDTFKNVNYYYKC